MLKRILIIVVGGFLIAACGAVTGGRVDLYAGNAGYEMISVDDLQKLMIDGDITLINVHVPLEGNIPETDLEIAYDQIETFSDKLPEDRSENIVIYCRSGSMGDEASSSLAAMGYTNVSNLEGGYVACQARGLPFGDAQ